MKLYCQLKELKRLTLANTNDTEYTIKLVTESIPPELITIAGDELIQVTIERVNNGNT